MRRVNAIKTLGETTVLCTDSMCTFTENRMTVARLVVGGMRRMIATGTASKRLAVTE